MNLVHLNLDAVLKSADISSRWQTLEKLNELVHLRDSFHCGLRSIVRLRV